MNFHFLSVSVFSPNDLRFRNGTSERSERVQIFAQGVLIPLLVTNKGL